MNFSTYYSGNFGGAAGFAAGAYSLAFDSGTNSLFVGGYLLTSGIVASIPIGNPQSVSILYTSSVGGGSTVDLKVSAGTIYGLLEINTNLGSDRFVPGTGNSCGNCDSLVVLTTAGAYINDFALGPSSGVGVSLGDGRILAQGSNILLAQTSINGGVGGTPSFNVLKSTDGGATFPTTLYSHTGAAGDYMFKTVFPRDYGLALSPTSGKVTFLHTFGNSVTNFSVASSANFTAALTTTATALQFSAPSDNTIVDVAYDSLTQTFWRAGTQVLAAGNYLVVAKSSDGMSWTTVESFQQGGLPTLAQKLIIDSASNVYVLGNVGTGASLLIRKYPAGGGAAVNLQNNSTFGGAGSFSYGAITAMWDSLQNKPYLQFAYTDSGTDNHIVECSNFALTGCNDDDVSTNFGDRWPGFVVADPTTAGTYYGTDSIGYVYRSTNSGAVWSNFVGSVVSGGVTIVGGALYNFGSGSSKWRVDKFTDLVGFTNPETMDSLALIGMINDMKKDPNTGYLYLAGTVSDADGTPYRVVRRSKDSGLTWSQIEKYTYPLGISSTATNLFFSGNQILNFGNSQVSPISNLFHVRSVTPTL